MSGHQIVLAGGPLHGRRLGDTHSRVITTAYSPPMPIIARPNPRPQWWRHPIQRFRWRPGTTFGASTVRALDEQHSYRRAGTLDDGTVIYWYMGPDAGAPPADDHEVLRHMWRLAAEYDRDHPHHTPGATLHIEMGPEWYQALRRAAAMRPGPPEPADGLFGYPIEVTEGSPRVTDEPVPARRR